MMWDIFQSWKEWSDKTDRTWEFRDLMDILNNWDKMFPFPTQYDTQIAHQVWEEDQPLNWYNHVPEDETVLSQWDEMADQLLEDIRQGLWMSAWQDLLWQTTSLDPQTCEDATWWEEDPALDKIREGELLDLTWDRLKEAMTPKSMLGYAATRKVHSFEENMIWFTCWWLDTTPQEISDKLPRMPQGASIDMEIPSLAPWNAADLGINPPIPRPKWLGESLNRMHAYLTGEPISSQDNWMPQSQTLQDWEEEGVGVDLQISQLMAPLFRPYNP